LIFHSSYKQNLILN